MNWKPLLWVGTSREDLNDFQYLRVAVLGMSSICCNGFQSTDFKAMPAVGAGVQELRIRAGGAFRVFYVAKFEEAIYVLHAFQKRSRRTARFDIDLGAKRYREVVSSRSR